jgi:hypothetical protein
LSAENNFARCDATHYSNRISQPIPVGRRHRRRWRPGWPPLPKWQIAPQYVETVIAERIRRSDQERSV